MQRSLRSLLSVDVADFTGLMSGKVKYYVGKLSVKLILRAVHEAFKKFGHVPLEDGENALEQYICLLVSHEKPLEILLG